MKKCFQETQPQDDVCRLPQESGECDDYVIQYAYNAAEGYCKAFYYGGCGGNGNRFSSEVECESACTGRASHPEDDRGKILFWMKGNFGNIFTITSINSNKESVVRSSID